MVALASQCRSLNGLGVEIIDIVSVGAGGDMTRQAIVVEQMIDFGPGACETHDVLWFTHLTVTFQANSFRIDLLA